MKKNENDREWDGEKICPNDINNIDLHYVENVKY